MVGLPCFPPKRTQFKRREPPTLEVIRGDLEGHVTEPVWQSRTWQLLSSSKEPKNKLETHLVRLYTGEHPRCAVCF
jgi:hypothetical protein